MERPWHSLSLTAIFQLLETRKEGLSPDAIKERLARYGENFLPRERSYSKLKLFLSQFNSLLIFILLAAGGISLFIGHYSDAAFITIVLFINTSVGFYQENKANASLQALRSLMTISARVLRGGNLTEIDSSGLVPGDVVLLQAGDKVPADARLIEQRGLKVDESSLTGEWVAVSKSVGDLPEDTPLADRKNMVHRGTIVEDGSATALVVATGSQTALGGIVSLLKETRERKTPLQQKIASLSRIVAVFVLSISALVMLLGFLTEKSFTEIFIASLALTVSAIPEGLLPAITVILTLGMRRVLKENGLVRKLIANETLGSVTVICTDKTGTLTEGKMQVSHILTGTNELLSNGRDPILRIEHADGLESHLLALKAAVLSGEAFIENPDDEFHAWIVRGRPTDRALLVAGTQAGLSKKKLEKESPRIDRIGFNSEAKYSASLHERPDGGKTLYVVGAPEMLAARSVDFHVDGTKERLDSAVHKKLLAKLETLTRHGGRVVACAHREFPKSTVFSEPLEHYIDHLTLVGYIALKDPLREDARDSIALTKRAGIRTILITGDHRLTAQSIAAEVGIEATDERVLEGKDLDAMSDEELSRRARTTAIYARVSPGHKLRIVLALEKNREVVAMIGDGVNDAPAIKAADVGVAVGSGTDVAKEVADIVLLDNDFKTIVKAIEQGRLVFQNIRKVFVYLVADDFSEVVLFLIAMALGLPLPLLAAQILWINLVEDGLPDIALTTEQETEGIMDEKPRDPDEPILNRPIREWMAAIFLITGAAAFLTFFFTLKTTGDIGETRTLIFALMCVDSLIFAFSVRSFKQSLFRKDIFSNRLLVGAVAIDVLLLLAAIYLPPLQYVLSTEPLHLTGWFLILATSAVEILLIEWFKKRSFAPAARPVPA